MGLAFFVQSLAGEWEEWEHEEMGIGCQEDLTIYGQFTAPATPRTYRDKDQASSTAGLVTASIKAIDGIVGGSILEKKSVFKQYL